jgi:hypothetical protein
LCIPGCIIPCMYPCLSGNCAQQLCAQGCIGLNCQIFCVGGCVIHHVQ